MSVFTPAQWVIAQLVLALALGTQPGAAHADDCVADLKSLYQHLEERITPRNGRSSSVIFSVRTRMRTSDGGETRDSRVRLVANESRFYLVSEEVEVYQDLSVGLTVTILRSQKRIVITGADDAEVRVQRTRDLIAVQGRVIDESTLVYCTEDGPKRHIKLAANAASTRSSGVLSYSFVVEPEANRLQRVRTDFIDGHAIESIELTIEEIDMDYSGDDLSRTPGEMVFDRRGKLMTRFQRFEVVDLTEGRAARNAAMQIARRCAREALEVALCILRREFSTHETPPEKCGVYCDADEDGRIGVADALLLITEHFSAASSLHMNYINS